MNVLHDMFPNFYDMSKEGTENRDISMGFASMGT